MKAALFDLDGTLLDTRDMILNSFRYAYTSVFGADTLPPDEKLLSLIGIPLKTQMEMISPEHSQELLEAYTENNVRVRDTMQEEFPGTTQTLDILKEKGVRMAVVTSKRNEPAAHGLKLQGILDYFEFLLGADDGSKHKPEPDPLLDAAQKMGLEPHECMYVGDSPFDMQAARAAGMYAVGALWGMFTKEELLEAGAEVFLEDITELPSLFA